MDPKQPALWVDWDSSRIPLPNPLFNPGGADGSRLDPIKIYNQRHRLVGKELHDFANANKIKLKSLLYLSNIGVKDDQGNFVAAGRHKFTTDATSGANLTNQVAEEVETEGDVASLRQDLHESVSPMTYKVYEPLNPDDMDIMQRNKDCFRELSANGVYDLAVDNYQEALVINSARSRTTPSPPAWNTSITLLLV